MEKEILQVHFLDYDVLLNNTHIWGEKGFLVKLVCSALTSLSLPKWAGLHLKGWKLTCSGCGMMNQGIRASAFSIHQEMAYCNSVCFRRPIYGYPLWVTTLFLVPLSQLLPNSCWLKSP